MSLQIIILYGLIFAVIYFVMLRPQIKQQKEKMAMLTSLKEGDRIATNGGIVGRITKIENNDQLIIETSNTKITILKPYVSHLVPSKAEQPKTIEKK